jgi:hypothetical protein
MLMPPVAAGRVGGMRARALRIGGSRNARSGERLSLFRCP